MRKGFGPSPALILSLSKERERVGVRAADQRKALKTGPHPAQCATPGKRETFAESRKREKGIAPLSYAIACSSMAPLFAVDDIDS